MKHTSSITNYLDMETKELFNIYSDDKSNKEVRDILIERNLYLVSILAKKYINKGVEFEDLYQVGSLALIYAIERYDISKGYEFSSFATPTIIGEIKKYFRDKVWTMRVPRRVQELNKKVNEAKLLLEQQNKKKPKVNEIAEYIEHNVDEVREDIVKMVAGIPVEVELEGYAASQLQLDSRDEILSAMVVFGFLSYHDGFLRIPNHELMEKFQRVLKRESMGGVADIVNNSKNVLDATIALDGQKVAQYIEEAHDREIPFLQYNNDADRCTE